MTQSPPPDPRSPQNRRWIDGDELIAVVIALASIGGILAWGLSRTGLLDSNLLLAPAILSQPEASPTVGFNSGDDEETTAEPGTDRLSSSDTRINGGIDADRRSARTSRDSRIRSRRAANPETAIVAGTVDPDAPSSAAAEVPESAIKPATSASVASFPDVPESYWAFPFILGLAEQGRMSGLGDGTFQPDAQMTRAQFAAALQEVFEAQDRREAIAFQDVPGDFWGNDAINTAVKSRFLSGYPGEVFRPNEPISRMEVLLSLVSGLQLPMTNDPDAPLQVYRDRDQIPEYAVPAIATATDNDLVVLYPDSDEFAPDRPATRAEVSAMIYQALVSADSADAVPSDYIVRP